jgi:hypothetical protein
MKKLLTLIVFVFPAMALATLLVGSQTFTVTTTAQVVDVSNRHFPMTVSIYPQAGTTGTAEFSTTPNAYAASGVANWQVIGTASAVSAPQTNTLPSPVTAIRFTRISGASAVIGEINYQQ